MDWMGIFLKFSIVYRCEKVTNTTNNYKSSYIPKYIPKATAQEHLTHRCPLGLAKGIGLLLPGKTTNAL